MNNRAQVSVEYLIVVALGIMIAALVTMLALNIFGIKDGIAGLISAYGNSFSGVR